MEKIKSSLKTYIIILIIGLIIIVFGGLTFLLVGNKEDTSWNFGNKKMVPGESPYTTERVK